MITYLWCARHRSTWSSVNLTLKIRLAWWIALVLVLLSIALVSLWIACTSLWIPRLSRWVLRRIALSRVRMSLISRVWLAWVPWARLSWVLRFYLGVTRRLGVARIWLSWVLRFWLGVTRGLGVAWTRLRISTRIARLSLRVTHSGQPRHWHWIAERLWSAVSESNIVHILLLWVSRLTLEMKRKCQTYLW